MGISKSQSWGNICFKTRRTIHLLGCGRDIFDISSDVGPQFAHLHLCRLSLHSSFLLSTCPDDLLLCLSVKPCQNIQIWGKIMDIKSHFQNHCCSFGLCHIFRFLGKKSIQYCQTILALFQVADQFNTLNPVLRDAHYFVCFYTTKNTTLNNDWHLAVDGDVCNESNRWLPYLLISLPPYWRMMQCLRRFRDSKSCSHVSHWSHAANAVKYGIKIITNSLR